MKQVIFTNVLYISNPSYFNVLYSLMITPVVRYLNEILRTDEEMSRVLSFKFINSKRKPKNLRRTQTEKIY